MTATTTGLTAAVFQTEDGYRAWLAPENVLTSDDRILIAPVGWREGRLALTFSDVEGYPHEEARHVGNLENLRREERDGESWIVADVDWDDDELSIEAKRLVDEDRIIGISVHLTDGEVLIVCELGELTDEGIREKADEFDWDTCETPIMAVLNAQIGSATLLMLPAFEDAEMEPVTARIDMAVIAADLRRPAREWFDDPQLTKPTPLTLTEDGRVFGHLALWNSCHRGFEGMCVTPPRDSTKYEEFHNNSRVVLDSNEVLGVGCLTVDVSHAHVRASADSARRHYDHSGTVAAYVRAGEDAHGVWVAGVIRSDLDPGKRELLERLSLSGDWRPKGSKYFLIAAQAVPVPGFPVSARVASGKQVKLITVGPAKRYDPLKDISELALVASALTKLADDVAYVRDRYEAEERVKRFEEAQAVFE